MTKNGVFRLFTFNQIAFIAPHFLLTHKVYLFILFIRNSRILSTQQKDNFLLSSLRNIAMRFWSIKTYLRDAFRACAKITSQNWRPDLGQICSIRNRKDRATRGALAAQALGAAGALALHKRLPQIFNFQYSIVNSGLSGLGLS